MALIELCAVCDDGAKHSTRSYPIIPDKLYARESTIQFRADNLLDLLPTDGKYRARIVDCYFDAPNPTKSESLKRSFNAYLTIEDLFTDGWRRTDHSNKLYHSRLVLTQRLGCSIPDPGDTFLPINTSFMTDRLSKEIVFKIDTISYIRRSTLPNDKAAFNPFEHYRKPIILFVVIELRKDDSIQ